MLLMMGQNHNFQELFRKYLSNQATAHELNSMFKNMEQVSEQELQTHIGNELAGPDAAPIVNNQTHLNELFVKIEEKIAEKPAVKLVRFAPWLKAAAAAAVIFGLAYLALFNGPSNKHKIVPGSSKAILTISNKQIELDGNTKTKFPAAPAVSVTTAKDGTIIYRQISTDTTGLSALHAVTTPAGGFYKVTLADGSQVYLNSKSTLEFPVGFYGPQRHVKLKGEAYFKVAKNKKMPFIVAVGETDIQVLGTSFIVNSFGKQTKTTLLEGSVQLKHFAYRKILAPGQEGLSDQNGIVINPADTAAVMAWTNGLFVFNDQSLTDVLHELSRWYDFTFDENSIPNKRLYIRLNRNTAFNDVLQMLHTTTGLKFKIEERRLSIEN